MTLLEDNFLKSEDIKEMATIFRKETTRPLTNYQRKMNEAAYELCAANPGLLRTRSLLMEKACAKIIEEGFQSVKGKSRSKKDLNPSDDQPTKKR